MKKFLALFLVLSLALSFVACGGDKKSDDAEETENKTTETANSNGSSIKDKELSQTHTHKFSEATCTEARICSCGATSGIALGHNYVNNTCTRCGAVDPDSLPVGLHELHVIDYSYEYKYCTDILKDTFGDTYVGYHEFPEQADEAYAIYNLNYKYTKFSCDIVMDSEIRSDRDVTVMIFVDNKEVFRKHNISKTTGKIHVDVDVHGGQQLKIVAMDSLYSWSETICIVNAQLTK